MEAVKDKIWKNVDEQYISSTDKSGRIATWINSTALEGLEIHKGKFWDYYQGAFKGMRQIFPPN
jgi:hypothetical protein